MTDQRLYIDGTLVDIDDDTKITLDIKSNLLRDVSKIVSNSTYTVKLPKTVHNQRIIAHSDKIYGGGDYPYALHTARYYKNGVEIIHNGKAVLLSVGDSIEISIIWGVFDRLSTLISNGTLLNQLESSDKILYNESNAPEDYSKAVDENYFYALIDVWKHANAVDYSWRSSAVVTSPSEAGIRADETTSTSYSFRSYVGSGTTDKPYSHIPPCVKATFILQLIKEQLGVDFQFDTDALDYIKTLIVPLISRKSNYLTYDEQFTASLPETSMTGKDLQLKVTVGTASNVFSNEAGSTVDTLTVAMAANVIFDVTANWSWDNTNTKPKSSGTYTYAGSTYTYDSYSHTDVYLRLVVTSGKTTTEYAIGRKGMARDNVSGGYKGEIKKKITGHGKIALAKGDTVAFFLSNHGALDGVKMYGADIKATVSTDENVPEGGYFPICYNLPKIKVIDFVKFLAAITGTFPLQVSDDGVVKFVAFQTVWNNIANAVDWSRRLIPNEGANKPKDMEYKVGDWCQHNWYRWKEDETVNGDYDADLLINNKNIEDTRDVITFPFAASDYNNVPMYTSNASSTTSTEPSYSACKDRILRLIDDGNGKAMGIFDIDMQAIIRDKYSTLTQALNNARVIKENIIISNIELLDFDECRPVYFAQYGAYFAVTEIKAGSNGTAEVTMLQLYTD